MTSLHLEKGIKMDERSDLLEQDLVGENVTTNRMIVLFQRFT